MKFFGPCLAPSCVIVWERVGGLEVRRPKVGLRVTRPPTAKLQASRRLEHLELHNRRRATNNTTNTTLATHDQSMIRKTCNRCASISLT